MCATFSFRVLLTAADVFVAFIAISVGVYGRRPRIEGLSLDRQENVSHFSVSCQLILTSVLANSLHLFFFT
ncbi:hypothetical protein MAXJ12_31082 [Mesorhizobium alhagi CCNWXJ12-2]|uniref:Uncharacterized protein n=1 Tax=Mesorhizobium alhagi CCNWXJ12-2 TaxID=1107882 RepID=H0I179_9HYPH|nr:hypothetical protein MAXJ12_31082 [Mesorhizobium alhagi CCNWXJ12-2]